MNKATAKWVNTQIIKEEIYKFRKSSIVSSCYGMYGPSTEELELTRKFYFGIIAENEPVADTPAPVEAADTLLAWNMRA